MGYGLHDGVEMGPVISTASKTRIDHWGSDTEVDTDVPDLGLVPELARGGAVTGEQTGHVAVRALVDELDASSTESTCMRPSTGPKISVRATALPGATSASRVAPTKLPFS